MRSPKRRYLVRIILIGSASLRAAHGGANDIALEDQIAKMFVSIRAEAHLPKLARIKHRDDLQGWTCTAAERDMSTDSWIYRTSDPLSSPQLRARALTLQPPEDRPRDARFAVAVWPARSSGASERKTFWVGINLYWSAWSEFVDRTFTDDMFYKNEWKTGVSPGCKSAQ